mmetsp:Transcript_20811/g.32614  ORF Transcript_20811/g.32614 Transcript_20811/m.32614 type:complete len:120 (+) Transcript_20811:604-963(+)|eukprot:CAMPEP_0184312462 /NCGR_PEP_ID=MMETSP1049-20130417/50571_1 /TAXON_ID=77928 /ORGANISM="Proteomonas sulcata, Strain CCMP704" /LENGTH=119 /DNA_ID=CAMNT_0026628671 /DNA_START=601 /DNA_END=960 /DNA_ORIENTATION=+
MSCTGFEAFQLPAAQREQSRGRSGYHDFHHEDLFVVDRYEAVGVLLRVMDAAKDKGFSPENSPTFGFYGRDFEPEAAVSEAKGHECQCSTAPVDVDTVDHLAAWYQEQHPEFMMELETE